MVAEQLQIRASDGDRDQVADLLTAAFGEGRLSHEEFDHRLNEALQARYFSDLVDLTRDLVPLDDLRPSPGTAAASMPARPAPGPTPDRQRETVTAILSSAERTGHWSVPPHLAVRSLCGGVEIDLSEAIWPGDRIEIDVQLCMAGATIKTGSDVRVIDKTSAILGGTELKRTSGTTATRELVITGTVLLAGLEIRGPKQKKPKKRG